MRLWMMAVSLRSRDLQPRRPTTLAATAAADGDTRSPLGPKDLENSLQRISNQPGELLLGRAAVRARAKAKAAAAAAAAGETSQVAERAAVAAPAASSVSSELPARRRLRHRQRILEEEGWDLLHRRVGAMRDMKQWL